MIEEWRSKNRIWLVIACGATEGGTLVRIDRLRGNTPYVGGTVELRFMATIPDDATMEFSPLIPGYVRHAVFDLVARNRMSREGRLSPAAASRRTASRRTGSADAESSAPTAARTHHEETR
jgi:hypothetical protein